MSKTVTARTDDGVRLPAEMYDEQFVPALFSAWAPMLCDATSIGPSQRVLDVACGTGALALEVAGRVRPGGAVVGLDANPEMLAVARRKRADVEWHEGRAESLPLEDACFDAVVSQFGLMFVDDRVIALREMQRVLRPGGRLAAAVCGALEHSPGYGHLRRCLSGCSTSALRTRSARHSCWAMRPCCAHCARTRALPRPESLSTKAWCASRRSTPSYRPSAPACGHSAACSTMHRSNACGARHKLCSSRSPMPAEWSPSPCRRC